MRCERVNGYVPLKFRANARGKSTCTFIGMTAAPDTAPATTQPLPQGTSAPTDGTSLPNAEQSTERIAAELRRLADALEKAADRSQRLQELGRAYKLINGFIDTEVVQAKQEGLTHKHIGEQLGVKESAVRTRLRRMQAPPDAPATPDDEQPEPKLRDREPLTPKPKLWVVYFFRLKILTVLQTEVDEQPSDVRAPNLLSRVAQRLRRAWGNVLGRLAPRS